MLIAIVGTRLSGKSSVEEYLVSFKGFTAIRLVADNTAYGFGSDRPPSDGVFDSSRGLSPHSLPRPYSEPFSGSRTTSHVSFLSMNSPTAATWASTPFDSKCLHFSSPSKMLEHVTRNWLCDFVTTDLNTTELVNQFVKRPFFMLLCIDAPIMDRFQRANSKSEKLVSLENFVREHDYVAYGISPPHSSPATGKPSSLHSLNDFTNIHVVNSFPSLTELHAHLDTLDLLNPARLRPAWDTYFMTLASLASHRSNCMKRRVGAILVREKRILATGYNGTPRGLQNCNEGGCANCNGTSQLLECVCLHAEENALLEAGRERVGDGAVLYCNTCPCLKCTVKIIQTGVREVVYSLSYKVDDASAKLFKQAGVELRRHDPKTPTAALTLQS